MKGIVTLVLMMLIGCYGVLQAQVNEMEEATKTEDATNDFLGLKWGAGIGVIGGLGGDRAVEKASIVNGVVHVEEEGDLRPHMFLEMHAFLGGHKAKNWRGYQRWKSARQTATARSLQPLVEAAPRVNMRDVPEPPLMGFGPFVALKSGDKEAIDSLAVGVMWGFRQDPQKSVSVNIGIGLSFDPSVQVLGEGLKDGDDTRETEVRFKKESQIGWALMTSFTF